MPRNARKQHRSLSGEVKLFGCAVVLVKREKEYFRVYRSGGDEGHSLFL